MRTTKSRKTSLKKYVRPCLTEDKIDQIKEVFDSFNTDGLGVIDPKELKAAMQSLDLEAKKQTIFQMTSHLDKNSTEAIDFELFLDMMAARMSDKDTREGFYKVFRLFYEDRQDYISIKDLSGVAKELRENISEEQLQEMIESADKSCDQQLTTDDFYNIMTKKIFSYISLQFQSCFTELLSKLIEIIYYLQFAIMKIIEEKLDTDIEQIINFLKHK